MVINRPIILNDPGQLWFSVHDSMNWLEIVPKWVGSRFEPVQPVNNVFSLLLKDF